ncbi:thioredoxin, partial [Cooperia oncophora]
LKAVNGNFSTGKVKAFVKSAPVPRDDKGPVRTLVASNFDKTFEPKYKELATNLKKTQPNLIIAKFDATANDAPPAFMVSGFPTIYFAPSGKKSTPIKYDGDRDLEEITKFMELHAVKSFQKKEDSKKEEL